MDEVGPLGRVPGVGEDFWICDPWTPTLCEDQDRLSPIYLQPSRLDNDLWRFNLMHSGIPFLQGIYRPGSI